MHFGLEAIFFIFLNVYGLKKIKKVVSNFLTNFYGFYRPDSRIRQNQLFEIKNDPSKSLEQPCKWDLRKYCLFRLHFIQV